MNLKIFVSILIFLVNHHTIHCQLLNCSYRIHSNFGYTCDLTIQNPNGLNNFTEINGTHLTGKSNNDVRQILRTLGSNSTNIPSIICETFQYATNILLYHSSIQTVDEYSFKNCKNLLSLSLDNNTITNIDEKAFSENLELQTLFLYYNQLTTLPENIFANQQKLTSLWLGGNKISDLPQNIFQSLKLLKILDLHGNQIEQLPRGVFTSLKELNEISLYSNKLKVIHTDSFGILPNLTKIYFYANQINAIDEEFIDNTGLLQLDMIGNLCAHVNIYDNSTSRQSMRILLQTCFNNYKTLYPDAPTTTAILTTTTSVTTTSKPTTASQTLPPGCSDGNLGLKVCNLKDLYEELNNKFDELANQHEKLNENLSNQNSSIKLIADENMRLKNVTSDMQEKIEDNLKEKEEMREHFEIQIEALVKENGKQRSLFSAALEDLQNQILVLTTRPCACH